MRKLTQKEYLEDLKTGSHFICATHNIELDILIDKIDEIGYQAVKESAYYKYTKVTKRSKDFVFLREDGTNSYRDFYGKNEYYTHKQVLLHVNIQDGHITIFTNL